MSSLDWRLQSHLSVLPPVPAVKSYRNRQESGLHVRISQTGTIKLLPCLGKLWRLCPASRLGAITTFEPDRGTPCKVPLLSRKYRLITGRQATIERVLATQVPSLDSYLARLSEQNSMGPIEVLPPSLSGDGTFRHSPSPSAKARRKPFPSRPGAGSQRPFCRPLRFAPWTPLHPPRSCLGWTGSLSSTARGRWPLIVMLMRTLAAGPDSGRISLHS